MLRKFFRKKAVVNSVHNVARLPALRYTVGMSQKPDYFTKSIEEIVDLKLLEFRQEEDEVVRVFNSLDLISLFRPELDELELFQYFQVAGVDTDSEMTRTMTTWYVRREAIKLLNEDAPHKLTDPFSEEDSLYEGVGDMIEATKTDGIFLREFMIPNL